MHYKDTFLFQLRSKQWPKYPTENGLFRASLSLSIDWTSSKELPGLLLCLESPHCLVPGAGAGGLRVWLIDQRAWASGAVSLRYNGTKR